MEQSSEIQDNSLRLSERSLEVLSETSKWANILSILGFIGLGLMVIVGTFGVALSATSHFGSGAIITLIYIVMAGLYSIPLYHLFKFASDLKLGLTNRRTYSIDSAFESLKSHYKFIGIFTIVILSLYLLIFLGSLAFMV